MNSVVILMLVVSILRMSLEIMK